MSWTERSARSHYGSHASYRADEAPRPRQSLLDRLGETLKRFLPFSAPPTPPRSVRKTRERSLDRDSRYFRGTSHRSHGHRSRNEQYLMSPALPRREEPRRRPRSPDRGSSYSAYSRRTDQVSDARHRNSRHRASVTPDPRRHALAAWRQDEDRLGPSDTRRRYPKRFPEQQSRVSSPYPLATASNSILSARSYANRRDFNDDRNRNYANDHLRNPRKGRSEAKSSRSIVPLKECIICAESKPALQFPQRAVTGSCSHPVQSCNDCVQTHIRTEMNTKLWHSKVVKCPECRADLEYADVERLADKTTFAKYSSRIFEDAIAKMPNFFRCPRRRCQAGQLHEDSASLAAALPIVTCIGCHRRFCFRHRERWHANMSCDEYDAYLADPENFRSAFDRANEEAEAERRRHEKRGHAQARAQKENAKREESRRVARQKRAEQVRRRRDEEAANLQTIKRTTKPCPGCSWAIEKRDGCNHMTCIKCHTEFYWCCLQRYGSAHSLSCAPGGRR